MTSIEEKVEEHYKALLDDLGIRHFGKTEEINSAITKALKDADSKSEAPVRIIRISGFYYRIRLAGISR